MTDDPSKDGAVGRWRASAGAATLAAASLGVLLGLGLFTLDYAQALSYLSTDPAACANCHIMQPQYDSWQRASHHAVAGCVDCHLPHAGIEKWIAKADNGYRHSRAFTFGDFDEPIMMTRGNREQLQANCLACHADLTHEAGAGWAESVDCMHCHRGVGHGERMALGGPEPDWRRFEHE